MTDIFYEVELGRIKKRYGNLVSINAAQTAEFDFVPLESYTAAEGNHKRIFALWNRTDLTEEEKEHYPLMSEITNNRCVIPSALFSRPGAYVLTVISWEEEGEDATEIETYEDIPETSFFRTTAEFREYIIESGCQNEPYAAEYGSDIFETIKELSRESGRKDELERLRSFIVNNAVPMMESGIIDSSTSLEQARFIVNQLHTVLLNDHHKRFGYDGSLYDFLHDYFGYAGAQDSDTMMSYINAGGAGRTLVTTWREGYENGTQAEQTILNDLYLLYTTGGN